MTSLGRARSALGGASVAAALLLAGCASNVDEARVCEPGGCVAGRTCVVGRCRASDAAPSPIDSARIVLAPVDVAVVAAKGGSERVSDSFALGRASSGTVVVFLRFQASWRDDAEVTSAFLVLDPVDGVPRASSALTIEVARILDPWAGESVTWGRQPRLGLMGAGAVVRPRASQPLRVDVTELVRAWAKRDKSDHGLALIAAGTDAYGATYSMGVAGGEGPRLEAYVR